jgi:hypothetical protein
MSVEAMLGAKGSFDPFVSEARPHIGQVRFFRIFHAVNRADFLSYFFFRLSCGDQLKHNTFFHSANIILR